MRLLGVLLALSLAQPVAAQVEVQVFGAMVEGPEGTPLASATMISASSEKDLYITSGPAAQTKGVCVRVWRKGSCHAVLAGEGGEIAGLNGLAVIAIARPDNDWQGKFSDLKITAQPLVAVFDPETDGHQLQFITQSALGGWEMPLKPADVTGQSANGITIRSETLNPMSLGAPVAHPKKGLVGVIGSASQGAARMIGIADVVQAALDAGYTIPPQMQPKIDAQGKLSQRVESELGRIYYFGDNSFIGTLSGFYGPTQGVGFDPNFVTNVEFSVWAIDPAEPSGTLLASGDKTLPLVPTGMALEAPFKGTPADLLATCVTQETPATNGRRALVMQFWRAVPARYNGQTGDKSYDEAAPPLTGWANDASTCASRIDDLDAERIAALLGDVVPDTPAVPPTEKAAADNNDTGITPDDWSAVEIWSETSRPAAKVTLTGGQMLTMGCTESHELAIALEPAKQPANFLIGDQATTEQGQMDQFAYGFFPRIAFQRMLDGADIAVAVAGDTLVLPGPTDLADGMVAAACREQL